MNINQFIKKLEVLREKYGGNLAVVCYDEQNSRVKEDFCIDSATCGLFYRDDESVNPTHVLVGHADVWEELEPV